ncbi:MAG: aldolase/citrate lyase family protein [Pseudomonadota bacterium]
MTQLCTMMITADPGIAAHAVGAGLDMLFVDLERDGKAARQGHLDTWKSPHVMADVARLRAAVPDARLMARLNPWSDRSAEEVAAALDAGADALMLPMFRSAEPVLRLRDAMGARAALIPLAETAGALAALPQILQDAVPEQVHIGLNDLALDMGAKFLFQPLADGSLERPCAALRAAGVPFGIGGVARLGAGAVPAELVLGEHARLGSNWVILSRAFHDRADTLATLRNGIDFGAELAALRRCYAAWRRASRPALEKNRAAFRNAVSVASQQR